MKKKFCRRLLSLALTGMAFLAQSQNPLKIGDALPKQFWETPLQMVNIPQKSTTLSADKDKLILLDFWNTWCSACILNFPKMEELQKQFGDKIKILAVSNQDRATLEKFFASKNGSKYNAVKSIADDKLMHKLFPHRGVPYIIWVKDGKLLNSTDAEQVNEKAIKEILGGEQSSLQTVVQMDREKPLMLSDNFEREKSLKMVSYSLLAKGKIRGMGSGTGYHRSGKVVYGRQFTNLSLYDIMIAIVDDIFQLNQQPFTDKNMAISQQDAAVLRGAISDSELYNYEYIVPTDSADHLYKDMLEGLNRFTDYTFGLSKKTMRCFVLKRTSVEDKIATKHNKTKFLFSKDHTDLQAATMYSLANSFSQLDYINLPVVNATNYHGRIDFVMNGVHSLEMLRKALNNYDLDLAEEDYSVDFLVVTKK